MKKHIAEELPARKHAPAAAPAPQAKGGEGGEGGGKKEQSSEKKIRQAVYDIRYRARREDIDLKQAFSQYMSNSSLSPQERAAVRAKLFGKEGGKVAEQYAFESIDWAVDGVANALFKVFVEGVEEPQEPIQLVYERQMESKAGTKYHVSVTDPKTGRKYTRFATREKITQLRAKGLKVDMTEHEDTRERAAAAKKSAGKKAKRDFDGDGKVESSSKEHAGAVHNAIQRAKGGTPDGRDTRKEDYVWTEGATGTTSTEGQNARKVDVMKSGEQNAVKVFPEMKEEFIAEKAKSKAQQRFMGMVYARKKGKMKKGEASSEVEAAAQGMSKKEAKKYASTEHEGLPEKKKGKKKKSKMNEEAVCPKCGKSPCECDTRANKTYRDLLKNKLRSAGKNVLAMMGDEENLEKSYDDMMTASFIKTDENGQLKPVHVFKKVSAEGYDSRYGRGEKGEPKATEILKLSPKAQEKYDVMMKELKAKSNQVKGV